MVGAEVVMPALDLALRARRAFTAISWFSAWTAGLYVGKQTGGVIVQL